MKLLDRLIGAAVVLVVGAVAISSALGAIVTVAVVGTSCFVVIRAVWFYTSR